MKEAGAANLALQYDLFHMRIMGDDLAVTIEANLASIGHMQLADVPDRHEPGTGEIDFPPLFDLIDRLGYKGWIGAEYMPKGKTADGLAWAEKYL
jgi:hydroxypyruvate isomerase